jgi:hypothetical protein
MLIFHKSNTKGDKNVQKITFKSHQRFKPGRKS